MNEYTEADDYFNKNYILGVVISDVDGGHSYPKRFYGRLNETLCCIFTDQEINYASNNGTSNIKVTFSFTSLITDFLTDSFLIGNYLFQQQADIAKLKADDGRVEIAETNIIGFTDNISEFTLPFYSHILALPDSDIILDLLEKTELIFHCEAFGGSSRRLKKAWKYY